MRINTKLVLLLTLGVGAAMLIASFLSLRQREVALESALSDELRAHAVTLQIALEENYQRGRTADAQRLVDRLHENSRVYGVFLFDENSDLRSLSQTVTATEFRDPPELKIVLEQGKSVEFVRSIDNQRFLSIILPINVADGKRGAVEMVKPFALIENDIARARLNWLLTTLLLLATIFLLVFIVLRQNLSRPIQALLVGARTLGRGDLSHRVAVRDSHDELAQLAAEFNRMAENLAEQRRAAQTETETRLNLEKELRHSERLASVGKLASGIAHELGAPLNVIDARAEQLLGRPNVADEKQIKNLTIIRSQCARITHIVRQLLNLGRPYNIQFEEIRIGDLIRSALEGFEASETIKIEFEANNGLTILGDDDFLRQAFVNIFQNAFHAMSVGGLLKIEVSKTVLDDKNFVVVEISDTGTGIAPDNLERIFDPFYTTKDIGEGTGLGLSVSRRIVEEHGGIIEASNNADEGASVTVYLPANKEL
ncbi:MAG: HAMP domain-containing protein [Chloracidobacterium sp.]|nr:HAMP domain-containing protein [Chloracidobacterium sp.]